MLSRVRVRELAPCFICESICLTREAPTAQGVKRLAPCARGHDGMQ